MHKATALFATTTFILALTSLHLARSLYLEKTRSAAAVAAAPVPSIPARAPQEGRGSPTPSKPEPIPANGETGLVAPGKPTPSGAVTQVTLPPRVRNRSPRSAELAYRRLEMQRRYPDLTAVLNLPPLEAERFFDLLAQQDLDDAEDEMASMQSGDSQGKGKERERERERRRQANRAEQATLLGEARAADWNKYLNSLGARSQIRELRMLLADSDYPLRRDQYEPLVALLAAEQVRHNDEREQLRRSMRDSLNPTREEYNKYMDQRLGLIEESLARRRRAAQTALDTEQLRHYQTMLEMERAQAQVEYDSFLTATAEPAQEKAIVRR